jgi:hypothetical protein
MNLPIELVNKILSYRPRHQVACLIKKESNHYNLHHRNKHNYSDIPFYYFCLERSKERQIVIANNKSFTEYRYYQMCDWYSDNTNTLYDFDKNEWCYNKF